MATVGVLALQGAARAHRRMLEHLGVSVREVRRPAHLDDVEALVIPGGESTTISLLLDRSGLRHPLVERLSGGMAVLGSIQPQPVETQSDGTLRLGDTVLLGEHHGRIKAMYDYLGKRISEAGPSTPDWSRGGSTTPC